MPLVGSPGEQEEALQGIVQDADAPGTPARAAESERRGLQRDAPYGGLSDGRETADATVVGVGESKERVSAGGQARLGWMLLVYPRPTSCFMWQLASLYTVVNKG